MTDTQAKVSETTTIFTGEQPVVQPTVTTGGELLNTLVGEGKKYKTVEDLAKSRLEADAFIEQLKAEKEEIRKDLESRLSLEQSLKEIKEARGATPPAKEEPASVPLDEQTIEQMIERTIEARNKKKTTAANIKEADRVIVDYMAGDRVKAEAFIKGKAEELGVGMEFLMSMAANSPKAFFSLVGVEPQKQTAPASVSVKSTVNTEAKDFANMGGIKPESKAYFDKIRRENPSQYWKAETQKALFKAKRDGKYV